MVCLGVAAGLVAIPGGTPSADAAFPGLPWQTNFEIEPLPTANTTVQGPTPPAGGAGVDWDNAAGFLQDFGNPTDFCGNGVDPTTISGKLDDFNLFAPNPVPDRVLNKGDICQAFTGWEVVNVTIAGTTELHYILYGGWRREPVAGEITVYYPLIGGPSQDDVTLIKFNYDSAGQGSTTVTQLAWNGSTWVDSPILPSAINSGVSSAQSPAFGEFAVDLTAAGIMASTEVCETLLSPYVFTQTGNAATAELKDILDVPNLVISNCSQVEITKITDPAIPDPPATFLYDLNQVDGGKIEDSTQSTPPNEDFNTVLNGFRGALTVPGTPTDHIDGLFAATDYRLVENPLPDPWSPVSVVCDYYDPLVLDANLNATLTSVTLTNPDGTWNNQTFAVAPPGLLPTGVTNAAECTIRNQAPSLTLVKQVDNLVRGPPATPDMWLLSAAGPSAPPVDYGPGTAAGVSRVVAPATYTLTETHNTNPAPPIGYSDGTTWTCTDSASGDPFPVTAGNQVTLGPADHVTCTITNTADPAQLTLQKVVDNDAGGSASAGDFVLTATSTTPGEPGSVDGLPISGATGTAPVTDRPVMRGAFTLTETQVPGYATSWACVDGTGATISTSDQVLVPSDITDLAQLDVTCTVTNTFAALDIDVSGSAVNPVGGSHTFTLTATSSTDGISFTPLEGAVLDLDFTTQAGLALGDVTFTSNSCETAPGTNADGQCTVTVSSSASGILNVSALGFADQGPNGPTPGAPFLLSSPVTANKTWLSYLVEGDASDINLIGEPHTFTLRGFQIAGTTDGPLAEGAGITFTWDGPGEPAGATALGGNLFQCTVAADGTCAVTVTSAAPATGTLAVTGIVVDLPNGETPNSTTPYTLTYPDLALQGAAPSLTKSWATFVVTVTPSAVNLIREPHPFVISVSQDLGSGPEAVADGTVVDYAWAGDGTPSPPASCVTANGSCAVTVTSDTPGVGTLTVVGLSNVAVSDGVTNIVIPSVTVDASGALTVPAPVEKRWVHVDVAITAGADNLAGEPHAFTVQVTAFDGEGGFPDGAVPDATVAASAVDVVGGATLTNDGTCDEGTDSNGQCTLIVTNATSGSIVVRLDQVSAIVNGELFVIDLTPLAPGLRADLGLPIVSDKVWWQYRAALSDSSTNPLGETHTFTATVERTNDGGVSWEPVPDGAFLDHLWVDDVVPDVSTVDPASTCLPTGVGTVDGTCTFIVSSTAPTTGTLSVTGIRDTWLDRNRDGDAGRVTDPEPDPDELADELVEIPAAALGTGSVLTAQKAWWDFTVDVEGPAENPVGDDHTFTLTVQYSDGGPAGFQPVEPGTTLTYAWAGPTGSSEDTTQSTCDPTDGLGTDTSGECTVVIGSPTVPGAGTLTITGIDSTTIPEPDRDISFTFEQPGMVQKTWTAYRAQISADATNLAGAEHPFTVTVEQDRGAGFVAAPDGTTVAVTLSSSATPVSSSCATGTVGGTCTVVVGSADPGSVTVTPGDLVVQLLDGSGASVPVTVEPGDPAYDTPNSATKTWVGFRLGVAPSATNPVGEPHTFTLTAEYATTAEVWLPLPSGTVDLTLTSTVAVSDPASSTCLTIGIVAGECTVTVTSTTPGTATIEVTGLVSATVTVGGVEMVFTNVDETTAPDAIEFTTPTATKTWISEAPVTWQVNKVSDPPSGSVVRLGDTITYTISATNTGAGVPTDLTVTDDLADVLDNAVFMDASITASIGTASRNGTILTWTIPSLPTTATVTYRVTISAATAGDSLVNAVSGDGGGGPASQPPTNCASPSPTAGCLTTHEIVSSTATNTPTTTDVATVAGTTFGVTGAESMNLIALGLGLIALGLGLFAVRRRRLA